MTKITGLSIAAFDALRTLLEIQYGEKVFFCELTTETIGAPHCIRCPLQRHVSCTGSVSIGDSMPNGPLFDVEAKLVFRVDGERFLLESQCSSTVYVSPRAIADNAPPQRIELIAYAGERVGMGDQTIRVSERSRAGTGFWHTGSSLFDRGEARCVFPADYDWSI